MKTTAQDEGVKARQTASAVSMPIPAPASRLVTSSFTLPTRMVEQRALILRSHMGHSTNTSSEAQK